MGTLHADVMRNAADAFMSSASRREVLLELRDRMHQGDVSDIDSIVQKSWAVDYDVYDAYAVLRVHHLVYSGVVARVSVAVGATPYPDRCVERNDALLKDLPSPFKAVFAPERGRGAECDGTFWWTAQIHACRTSLTELPIYKLVDVEPRGVPLEVGTTSASRTWAHLVQGGVARWPYGSKRIFLYVVPDIFDAPGPRAVVEGISKAFEKLKKKRQR